LVIGHISMSHAARGIAGGGKAAYRTPFGASLRDGG
jgi:hypothetical protein